MTAKRLSEFAAVKTGWPYPLSQARGPQAHRVLMPRAVAESGVVRGGDDVFKPHELPRRADDFLVQPNDVLFVARATTNFKIGWVEPGSAVIGAVASSNLFIIRPGPQLLGSALAAFLMSADATLELRRRSTGASTLAIARADLESLMVPDLPLGVQERVGRLWIATRLAHETALEAAAARRRVGGALIDQVFREAKNDEH